MSDMSEKSRREQREKNKCNQNCPFLEHRRKTRFGFCSFSMNCFDMKLLINNSITGNRIFPTGSHCGRWYKVIPFAFVNIDLTSAPSLKSRHPMVLTFHDKQSWDSPACSGQILGPLIQGHFAFQSLLHVFFCCLLNGSQETNNYHIPDNYSLPTRPPSKAHIYSALSSGYTSPIWTNLISKCQKV